MLTAEQARIESSRHIKMLGNIGEHIGAQIEKACKNGNYSCRFEMDLSKKMVDKVACNLIELGYHVHVDHGLWEIYWYE